VEGQTVSHYRILERIGQTARIGTILALNVLSTAALLGDVVPGRWAKVAILPLESQIVLTLRSGDRIECKYQSLSNTDLVVVDMSGSEVNIPRSEVAKITSGKPVADPLWNGPLIGLGIGAGAGALLGAALYDEDENNFAIFSRGETAAITAVVGAAIGVTIGLVTDVVDKSPEVLYVAVNDNPSN
jgi:hypothetical protein